MFLAHWSKREKLIASIVLGLAFFFLIYSLILEPLLRKLSNINAQIVVQESKFKKNLKILSQEKKVASQYKQFAELMRLKASDEQEMAKLLSEIESVAQGINIRILDMKPQRIKNIDFYKNFSVALIIDGQLKDITQFLYSLQNLPHLIKVDKLHLEKESAFQPELKASLQVSKDLILQ